MTQHLKHDTRPFRLSTLCTFAAAGCLLLAAHAAVAADRDTGDADDRPPNIILMFCDNLGYGDIEPFGSELHRTPNLNRMAAEGTRFTHFYVSSGVCTPSRASLMTGCYPRRVSMHATDPDGKVLRPVSPNGLQPREVTIAEILKQQGYATGIFGKWHLGDQPRFLPTRQGFDYYIGVPYSDDMTQREGKPWPPLPLLRNEKVVDAPVDRNGLTKQEAEEVVRFITEHRDEPFFAYVPHAMPGSTRAPFASEKFRGRSQNGPYGDAVEELDWAAGEILDAVDRLELAEETLVIWTSDNGAPRRNPPQGRNTPLAGWGYTTAEGGMRVPCLMRWKGRIPAGRTCDELITTMDLLPTFARLAGTQAPQDRIIDGKDVRPLLFGKPGAKSPHVAFYYYNAARLEAVRSGKWKLYVPGAKVRKPELYDVVRDPGEKHNRAERHGDVVRRLRALAEVARNDLGDGEQAGANQRPHGRVKNPQPLTLSGK